jgi:hypothetical protein
VEKDELGEGPSGSSSTAVAKAKLHAITDQVCVVLINLFINFLN